MDIDGLKKIHVYKRAVNGKLGIGVEVVHQDATLADLLAVWEPLADDREVEKLYSGLDRVCASCVNNCCNMAYVIPDLIAFNRMTRYWGCSSSELLMRFFDPAALAVGIPRLRAQPCIFLDDRKCSIYPLRTLVCRFYLCTNLVGDTEELIYATAAAGAAALFQRLESDDLLKPSPSGMTGFDKMLLETIARYRNHPGTLQFLEAESYDDIKLKPFLE